MLWPIKEYHLFLLLYSIPCVNTPQSSHSVATGHLNCSIFLFLPKVLLATFLSPVF